MIKEENLIGNIVMQTINDILKNQEQLQKMRECAKNFYKPDAAKMIAKDLIKLGIQK